MIEIRKEPVEKWPERCFRGKCCERDRALCQGWRLNFEISNLKQKT